MNPPKVSDNEVFITLISAAKKDRELAEAILAITTQPETTRKIHVLQLAQKCRQEGAPVEFLSTLIYLGENRIAQRVSRYLEGAGNAHTG